MSTARIRRLSISLIPMCALAAATLSSFAVGPADGLGAISEDNWALEVSFAGIAGGRDRTLTPVEFGVHPAGTGSFDQGIDLLLPPPNPGPLVPDAYLFDAAAPSFLQRLTRDLRDTPASSLDTMTWTLVFENNAEADWTMGWDIADMPERWTPLRLRSDGMDVDMREVGTVVVPSQTEVIFTIEATLREAGDILVARGLAEHRATSNTLPRAIDLAGDDPVFVNAADPGAPVSVEAASSDPNIVSVTIENNEVVLTFGEPGDAIVVVQAVNADGSPGPAVTFPVLVLVDDENNEQPVVEPIRPVVMDEGVRATVVVDVVDPDDDPVFLSVVGVRSADGEGVPALTVSLDRDLPQVHLEAAAVDKRGERFLVDLTVEDGITKPVAVEFMVVVRSGNEAPAIAVPDSVVAAVGEEAAINVVATDPNAGDIVELTAALRGGSAPTTSAFAAAIRAFNQADAVEAGGSYTKSFVYAVEPELDGTYADIWWTADDGFASSSSGTQVVVGAVNLPPEVEPVDPQVVAEGGFLEVTIVASDPEGGPLTARVTGMPEGASFDPNTFVLRWTTIPFGAAGRHLLTLRLTDDGGATKTCPIDITVTDVNQAPTIVLGDSLGAEGLLAELTIVRGIESAYVAQAYDADGDDIQLAISGLPEWVRGRRTGDRRNPTAILQMQALEDSEPFSFVLTATDPEGVSAEETVSVLIEDPPNLPPRVEAPLAVSVQAGGIVEVFVPAVDPNDDPLTLTIQPQPAGLSATEQDGGFRLTWRTEEADARDDPYVLTLTVTDEEGAEAAASFVITVELPVNRPPSGGDALPVVVEEGDTVVLDLLDGVFDVDGDVLTADLTTDLPQGAFSFAAADGIATLTVSPGVGDAGAYTAEVTISDGHGGRLVHGWSITVPAEVTGQLAILSTTPTVIESTALGGYRFIAVITTPNGRDPDSVRLTVTHNSGVIREFDMSSTGIGDLANGAVFATTTRLAEGSYTYTVGLALDGEVQTLSGNGPRVGSTLVLLTQLRALARSGEIPFAYALLNPNPTGRANLAVDYRRRAGDPWTPASVTGDLIEVTSGVQLTFTWDSSADVPDAASEPIQVQITPENGIPRVLTLLVANVPPSAPTLDPLLPSSVTTVRVSGSSDSPGADVDIITQDGKTVGRAFVEPDGLFAITVTLPAGRSLLSAIASLPTDVDGDGPRSLASLPIEVVVDPAPPILAVASPVRGSSVATRTPTISVRAEFGISGGDIDSADMRVSGKSVPVEYSAESGLFTGSKELPDLRAVLVTFVVRKANGLSSSVAWTFTVDLSADDVTPPEVAGVRPRGVARRVGRVEATLRDGESGVDADSIEITLDGDTLAPTFLLNDARSGLAVADIPNELAPGDHDIVITVADIAGNETTETRRFTIAGAVQPPSLDDDFDFSPTNSANATLSGSAEKDVDVAVFVGNSLAGVARADDDGRWELDITFGAEGSHVIHAQAQDANGVKSTGVVFGAVAYDLTPPRVVVAVPALGSVTGDLDPVFIGTVSDRLSGVDADSFEFAIGAPSTAIYDAATGQFTAQADDPLTNNSSVTVVVTASDLAGNVATLEGPVSLDARLGDATPPAILSASIDGAALAEGATPVVRSLPATVALSVVDDRSGVSSVDGLLDGEEIEFTVDGDAATLVVDGLATGEHILLVRAADGEGNVATVRRYTFAVGAALAGPSIDAPAVTSNPDLTITGVGIPPSVDFRLLVNDAPVDVSVVGASFTSAPTRLQEGDNTVAAIVEDANGDTAQTAAVVVLDTQAPRVTFLQPIAGAAVGPQADTIRVRFDDDTGVDVSSASLTLDGEAAPLTDVDGVTAEYVAPEPFAASDAAGGDSADVRPHFARAVVRDTAGNLGSASITFVVDAVAPSIEGVMPTDGEIVQTLEPTVSAAITARDVDPATLEVLFGVQGDTMASVVDDANFEYLVSLDTFIFRPLVEDGATYDVLVRVADQAGNVATSAWAFSVDTQQIDETAPIITVLYPKPGQAINDAGLDNLSFSLGDAAGVDPSRVHLFVNDPTGAAPLSLGRLEDEGVAEFNRATGVVRILGRRLFRPYQGARGGFSFDPLELNALERSLTGGEASFDPLELNALERNLSAGDGGGFDAPEANTIASSLGQSGGGLSSSLERSLNTGVGLLGRGENTMGVQVADLAGNVSFATWSFSVSLDPPSAPVFDGRGASTGEQATTIAGHVPGLLTGETLPVIVDLRVNEVSAGRVEITTTDGRFAFTNVSIVVGDNVMTATAEDNAGNLSSRSDTMTLVGDMVAPVITLLSMPSALPTNQFTLSGKVTDDRNETPTSVTVKHNGATIELGAALGSFNQLVTLDPGQNTLSVEAVDPAGNVGSSPEFTITIDDTSPETAPASVTARPTPDGRGIALSWAADANAANYVVYQSSSFFTDATNTDRIAESVSGTSHTVTAVEFGATRYYGVGSADAAGNTDPAIVSPVINVALMDQKGGTAALADGTRLTVEAGGLFTSPLQTATVSLTLPATETPLGLALDGATREVAAYASSGAAVGAFERPPSLRIPVDADVDLVDEPPVMRQQSGATWEKLDSAPDVVGRAVTADAPSPGTYRLTEDGELSPPWDVNGDGVINIIDLVTVARDFGKSVSAGVRSDTNGDGSVNIIDLVTVASHFGEDAFPAAPMRSTLAGPDATVSLRLLPATSLRPYAQVEVHATASTPIAGYEFRVGVDPSSATLVDIQRGELLPEPAFWMRPVVAGGSARVAAVRLDLATGASTPAREGVLARITLDADITDASLVQLRDIRLSDSRGNLIPYRVLSPRVATGAYRTALLPNFPNPFNPETWIPFSLAAESDVTVRIYDTTGARIRTLVLGKRPAGEHAKRGDAAYWDGRNERGESAASGVYFVELRAGDTRVVRRMTISK
jgi:hypothetical protein